jgi:hypothetical protein
MNALTHTPRNRAAWLSIASFLDDQFLASQGLTRMASEAQRQGPACGMGPQRVALPPLGNHGDNNLGVGK